jgi:hypothetical protein
MLGERLEDAPRQAEAALGGLVGIGGGADDHRLALHEAEVARAALAERAPDERGRLALHEDAPLEGEPGRERRGHVFRDGVGAERGGGAVEGVAVGEARVAVAAAEGTADIGIDGPVAHSRGFGAVEDGARPGREVADVGLDVEHRKRPRRGRIEFGEERGLAQERGHLRFSGVRARLRRGARYIPNKNRRCKAGSSPLRPSGVNVCFTGGAADRDG